eukprot:13160683-Alexandrium_andersonii.AAC.1
MPPRRRKPEKVLRWDFVQPGLRQDGPVPEAAQGAESASPYSSARPPSRTPRAPARSSPASSSSAAPGTSGDTGQPNELAL